MLTFQIQGTEETLSLQARRVVIAGYTGRDQAAVQRHVDELRAHGIPAPARVPTLFPCTVDRMTTANEIEVLGNRTSGEAEFALIYHHGEIYVAAASDHTDRDLERTSITFAKQVCPKVLSREVWPYAEVSDHWDAIVLRGWAGSGSDARRYQEGALAEMLPPDELEALVRERLGGVMDGTVIYSGTLPILGGGGFDFSATFAVELQDPGTDQALRCEYSVREVTWAGD